MKAGGLANIPALILVGGLGSRLRPVISGIPKPMAPILGKPFLEYLVRWLVRGGIKRIVLCAGYRAEEIQSYFGQGQRWNVKIEYSIEQEPLGTWGAIRLGMLEVGDSPVLVLNGDSWVEIQLDSFADFHRRKHGIGVIAASGLSEPSRFGSLKVNAEGRIEEFAEKTNQPSGLINGGIYMLCPEIVSFVSLVKGSLERQIFPQLLAKGVYAYTSNGFFVDIGIPEEYTRLNSRPEPWLRAMGLLTEFHHADTR